MAKKTSSQLDREIAAALIAGDAELEGKFDVGKKIRKQEGAKAGALLGYTESAKPVFAHARSPTIETFAAMRTKFPRWSQEDHKDASRLHKEAAEAALTSGNQKLANNLEGWSRTHSEMQSAPTEMTKATRTKVLSALRKYVKDEWNILRGYASNRLSEQEGERAAERAIDAVTKSLGPMLGGVKLAARGNPDTVEIWNQTGPYDAPEFVIDLTTGRVR